MVLKIGYLVLLLVPKYLPRVGNDFLLLSGYVSEIISVDPKRVVVVDRIIF
jgi:hypothetical protein